MNIWMFLPLIIYILLNYFLEFDIWSDFLTTEMTTALRLDTLDSSHPIQVSCIVHNSIIVN